MLLGLQPHFAAEGIHMAEQGKKDSKWLRVDESFHQYCEAIREAVKKTGMPQKDICTAVGVDQTTISRVCTGHFKAAKAHIISPELFARIEKLAKAMNVPVPQLKAGKRTHRFDVRHKPRKVTATEAAPQAATPVPTTAPAALILKLLVQKKITAEDAAVLMGLSVNDLK